MPSNSVKVFLLNQGETIKDPIDFGMLADAAGISWLVFNPDKNTITIETTDNTFAGDY